MAKGVEDTMLYRQVRLLARCEVGCDLGRFALPPDEVHRRLAALPPRTLVATSTHDSKRGEDVRARIAALSEVPGRFVAALRRWSPRVAAAWGDVAPDPLAEHGLWQTLVGAWPIAVERVRGYVTKAAREAQTRTSWRRPDAAYEAALLRVVDAIYTDAALVDEIAELAAAVAPHGDRNALAQLLIKLTCPGVPDIYQGCELREDSLVDPDNRRPIDFEARRRALAALRDARIDDVGDDLGRAKLWTIRRVLGLRRRAPQLFEAPYRPVPARGQHADRVFAYARGDDLFVIVPRLGTAAEGWLDTWIDLPVTAWRDVLSDASWPGSAIALGALWRRFPIALLVRDSASRAA